MTNGDIFNVTVNGDVASFITWKERITNIINGSVVSYTLFPDGILRYVSFRVEMVPDKPAQNWLLSSGKSSAKRQAAWLSIIAPPLLRIYWLAISDSDASKWELIKPRLEAWLDLKVGDEPLSDIATMVVLHIEPLSQVGSVNRANQQLGDKIRTLKNGNVHCITFQPYNNKLDLDSSACDRLTTSLHSLLAIQIVERIRRVEDIGRVERERCCRAAMAGGPMKDVEEERVLFANMFLLEEAVARAYAALALYDEALARLDIIDAVISQSAANCFCQSGRPVAVWIDECLAHAPTHVDCCRLVPEMESDWPTSPCPLMLLETGKHPLIETRAELLARQTSVIFRMATAYEKIPSRLKPSAAATRLANYALQVAHCALIESRQLMISTDQCVIDAFVYLLFCEASAACQVLASSSMYSTPSLQSPISLNVLGYQALRALLRLGRRCGLLNPDSGNQSENLQATVSILQLLRKRSASLSTESVQSARPETHSDHLAKLLGSSSVDELIKTAIELAESLLATLKASGCRRWARRISFEIAEIHINTSDLCKTTLPYVSKSAAEPLLLGCVGAWLASRYTGLAQAALRRLVDHCYVDMSDIQQLRRCIWTLLHLKAYNNAEVEDSEIAELCQKLVDNGDRQLLSGSFLFQCTSISLVESCQVEKAYRGSISLKISSKFNQPIENCHVEVVIRLASLKRPASDRLSSYDHAAEQHSSYAHRSFRPEVPAMVHGQSFDREHEELLILKTASLFTLNPGCNNDIVLNFEVPMSSDFQSGALLHYVRTSVDLFTGAVTMMCGTTIKSTKPMILRPKFEANSGQSDDLREISLTEPSSHVPPTFSGDAPVATAKPSMSVGRSEAVFGAEFWLEPVPLCGVIIFYLSIDIIQNVFINDDNKANVACLIDPVAAVELDGDDALMLDRPIFDYSQGQQSIIIAPISNINPSFSLARLTWQLPQIPRSVKKVRILMSCTVKSYAPESYNEQGASSDDDAEDSEDRLTIASQYFDVVSLLAQKKMR